MPERVGSGDDRPEGRPVIRKVRAVVNMADPKEAAAWEAEWGDYNRRMAEERERQERGRRDDTPSG